MKKRSNSTTKTYLIGFAVIVILGIIFGINYFATRGAYTQGTIAKEISVQQAASLREEGAFVLDVRQPEEWEAGHISGATLIPLGELSSRLSEIPSDKTVVVVCRSGNRSAQGRDILLKAGFSPVTSMGGGMTNWVANGYPTVTGP